MVVLTGKVVLSFVDESGWLKLLELVRWRQYVVKIDP